MSDEVIKVNGKNMICLDQGCTGCFGEENVMKFNNAMNKMQYEVTANPGVIVQHIASNKQAALYAVASRLPNHQPITEAIYYKYKTKEWTATISRCSFTRDFARKYLKSIYGLQCVSELDVVRELVLFLMSNGYNVNEYGDYFVGCAVGGLLLMKVTTNEYTHYLDFIAYEDIDSSRIKGFYGDVLNHYISEAPEFKQNCVSRELLMELMGLRPTVDEFGEISGFERINDK